MALLSVSEAAARYPLSGSHIRRLARRGVLKAQRFGKKAWPSMSDRSAHTLPECGHRCLP